LAIPEPLQKTRGPGLIDHEVGEALAQEPAWTFQEPWPTRAQQVVREREAVYRRLLATADLVSTSGAMLLAVSVVQGNALNAWAWLALPAVVVFAKAIGLYERDRYVLKKTTLDEVPTLFHMTTLTAFVLWLLQDMLLGGTLSAVGALALWGAMFIGVVATRALARIVARRIAPSERCLVVGGEDVAGRLVARLRAEPGIEVDFVHHLDPGEEEDLTAPAQIALLRAFIVAHDIHRVVLAGRLGDRNREDVLPVIGELKRLGVRVSMLPSISRVGRSSFEVDRVDGITLLAMRGFEFSRSSLILKRAIDLTVSALALVVLAPAFLLIAIVIKLDSRGPALYRQTRIGRHGEPFQMVKFRTMYERAHERRPELTHLNEASDGLFRVENDPRVTRVGRFLRSLSIDELPQLWNVLMGQMSLVGPRPLVGEEDRLIEGWHRQRLALTPGMTGYWQILGSARVPLEEMVRLDYSYVQNWSAWDDVKLMLRTIPYLIRRNGV
jgi:exopolysaccharide biosynthesis polyprenyl glycosylphosphotransferase